MTDSGLFQQVVCEALLLGWLACALQGVKLGQSHDGKVFNGGLVGGTGFCM